MKIMGYSERGIVSSLFNEIAFSANSYDLLSRLLRLVVSPFAEIGLSEIQEAKLLIEQSFSDFGDLDALLLLTHDGKRLSLFFEAKVKTLHTSAWSIDEEWDKFSKGIESRVSSSNLFTQLYHKVRLVEGLRVGGIHGLQIGLEFPRCSTKSLRKIGKNEVVLRAVNLLQQHLDNVFYIGLVPEESLRANQFFKNVLRHSAPEGFIGWDIRNYGYIIWADVEQFCVQNNLENTLGVFSHNKEQIY